VTELGRTFGARRSSGRQQETAIKTKSGRTVPKGLATVLHKGKSVLTAWSQMRSSSQKTYVTMVEKAQGDPVERKKALAQVEKLTRKFGKRHSEQRKNRGPA
jgi:hypothetical protein